MELHAGTGISQLPVLRDGLPWEASRRSRWPDSFTTEADPDKVRVADVMARPLPQIDVSIHLDEAYRLLLSGNTGVLAVSDGGRGHHHTDRPDPVLEPDEQADDESRAVGVGTFIDFESCSR